MKRENETVYIAADVAGERVIYRGYWEAGSTDGRRDSIEEAPTVERLREILEWAFARTDDVLVRLDSTGEYWRAQRVEQADVNSDIEGHIHLARRPS